MSYMKALLDKFGDFIKIGTLWITAIGAYYAWSVIARWVKIIS